MKAYRRLLDLPPERLIKGLAGRLLISCAPGFSSEIRKRPFAGNWGYLGRLIRNGYYLRAVAEKDFELTQRFLTDFWKSPESRGFFDNFPHRFESVFLRHHAGIVGEIDRVFREWPDLVPQIVEIGVGDGQVLAYLESRLKQFGGFHGIDVNRRQIEINRKTFSGDPKFAFSTENTLHWLIRNPAPGTVIYTNGGVFEYFTRGQLLELFRELAASSRPCAVAVTETIAIDHDLRSEPESFHYGREFSISHNYPAILREAGFEIRHLNDRSTEEGEENHPERWFQVLAVAKTETGSTNRSASDDCETEEPGKPNGD